MEHKNPTTDRAAQPGQAPSPCVRMTVVRWDDASVYGKVDGQDQLMRLPLRGDGDGEDDSSYLTSLLEAGMRLNWVDGVFVLEPDYLVDITAIAACFETYAESHLVHLLNKIRPAESTEALVLGNLASQLLDEEVHASRDGAHERPYSDSVRDFFQGNALSLLTAHVSDRFHEQGRIQQQNIRHAVRDVLPAVAGGYDAREVMLEPSFFCERLGLQGRMDFLQLDRRVLIEQKSGKGAFPQPDPDTPIPQLKHYIQLLLYMALLEQQQPSAGQQRHAFLLYSKYREGLQPVTFSRPLLQRAFRIRNDIAAAERRYARGGMDILATLTPEQLNQRGQGGKLWQQYVRPQIEAVLAPLHTCSPLERAYCLRFQTFLAAEHLRAKVGTGQTADAGFSAKWRQTLPEKLMAGDIYADLTLVEPQAGDEGRVDSVLLSFCDTANHDIANFRVGDIVILYPYDDGTEPDCCRTMVFRSTIAAMTTHDIRLALRAAQTDAHVFLRNAHQRWAIEHDFLESSFASLYRGMHAFLSAPKERRDLLLFQRKPAVDTTRRPRLAHGDFDELALRVKQARDLFLIIGPPGTGKTSYGLMTTLREELAEPGASVLLLSYTNRAVDEVCSKLLEQGIDFVRVGSPLSCAEAYRPRLLGKQAKACQTLQQLRHIVTQARVVAGTTTALSAHSALLALRSFSLAIVDEASQILEPHLMSLLAAQYEGQAAIRKFVLIGDHKQLPAVVQQTPAESRVLDPALNAVGLTDCRLSLFERLLRRYADDPSVAYMLTRQGRMHPAIARFPSEAFYGGRLREVPLPHQQAADDGWPRVSFVDVPPSDKATKAGKVNAAEAEVIARYVVERYSQLGERFTADSVGVIVPYRNQIAAVRTAIATAWQRHIAEGDGDGCKDVLDGCGHSADNARNNGEALDSITIDTVERFQGSQRDTIVYGFTVQDDTQLDFLTELAFEEDGHVIDRKLNVAMTRAREHLILVGNAVLLRHNPLYARLIDFVHELPAERVACGAELQHTPAKSHGTMP